MILAIIITIFSSYLEGIVSIYTPIFNCYFLPLFTLVSTLVCFSCFSSSKNYFIFCFVVGVIYDVVYTDTIFFHAVIYVFIAYLFQKMIAWFWATWTHFVFSIITSIFIYRILTYIILLCIGYIHFDFLYFIQVIVGSLILNIIYGIILYFFLQKYCKRRSIKRLF